MNKSKVLHIVGGMDVGGTETMIMNIYRKCSTEVEFHFVSYYSKKGYYDEEIISLGGKIINLENPKSRGIIASLKDLISLMKNEKYQAVHCHTLFNCGIGVLAAKIAGVDIRISHAHTTMDEEKTFIRKVYITAMRFLINTFSTKRISCSLKAAQYLFGYNIEADEKFEVLPNYIDYNKFITGDGILRKELGFGNKDIIVGHAGRFIDTKNHLFLLNLIATLVDDNPRIHCVLIGEGELKISMEKRVKTLKLENNVHFLGLRNAMENIFKDFDIFILPSKYEGLGMVLLEAQAAGIPCLTSTAVQPEADLGIGLIKRINLEADMGVWKKSVYKMMDLPKVEKKLRMGAFENKGYKMEDILDKFKDLYGVVGSDEVEKEKCVSGIL